MSLPFLKQICRIVEAQIVAIESVVRKMAEKYFSMYVDFIVALAKKGQHEKVIKLIQSIDIEKTQSRNGHENDAKAILAC